MNGDGVETHIDPRSDRRPLRQIRLHTVKIAWWSCPAFKAFYILQGAYKLGMSNDLTRPPDAAGDTAHLHTVNIDL